MFTVTKLGAFKFVVNCVVGMSTGYVVKEIIESNVEPENALETAKVFIGAGLISSMAIDAARGYVNQSIDEGIENYRKLEAELKKQNTATE